MLVGGISYHWLTKLIILDGTLNEFSYGQGLLFYKDDINSFNLKHNSDICLDQAGAPTHRCKSNIENIWGIIKQRVKRGIRNFSRVKTIFSWRMEICSFEKGPKYLQRIFKEIEKMCGA